MSSPDQSFFSLLNLLSSLPSGYFLTHTPSTRSRHALPSLDRLFCLHRMPLPLAWLALTHPSKLGSALPPVARAQDLVCPHSSSMPLSASPAAPPAAHPILTNLHCPRNSTRGQGHKAGPGLSGQDVGLLHPCELLPGTTGRKGTSAGDLYSNSTLQAITEVGGRPPTVAKPGVKMPVEAAQNYYQVSIRPALWP